MTSAVPKVACLPFPISSGARFPSTTRTSPVLVDQVAGDSVQPAGKRREFEYSADERVFTLLVRPVPKLGLAGAAYWMGLKSRDVALERIQTSEVVTAAPNSRSRSIAPLRLVTSV